MTHPRATPVAGLDVGATSIAVADRVAGTVIGAVRGNGVVGHALRVGIHRILHDGAPSGTHLALSISVEKHTEHALWGLMSAVADAMHLAGHGAGVATDSAGIAVGARHRGDRTLAAIAAKAASEQRERTGGRALYFGGVSALRGPMSVSEILAVSAIDAVVDLFDDRGTRPDDLVLLGPAVRPRWQFGLLVLHVAAAPGTDSGVYLPFDTSGGARLSEESRGPWAPAAASSISAPHTDR